MYLELDNATLQELLSVLDDTENDIDLCLRKIASLQQDRTAILDAIAAA